MDGRTRAGATGDVLSMRNWLKMGRIDTKLIAAKVIDGETGLDRSDEQFVGEAVHHHQTPSSGRNYAIAATGFCPRPDPTTI